MVGARLVRSSRHHSTLPVAILSVKWSFDTLDAREAGEVRERYLDFLQTWGTPDSDCDAAALAFAELVGNVVRHAPGPFSVVVDWAGIAPVLHVRDRGPGFARPWRLPSDPMSEHGRGLFIVQALAGNLRITSIPAGGTQVSVKLPIVRVTGADRDARVRAIKAQLIRESTSAVAMSRRLREECLRTRAACRARAGTRPSKRDAPERGQERTAALGVARAAVVQRLIGAPGRPSRPT
jgi:serine/threonine-protein kinase RsbW